MTLDRCIVGDCRNIMRQLIQGGVTAQTAVTSPPYWGLRDYGMLGQIGLERTPIRYLARMRSVFRLVWQLLADDGTLWLNMGDCYYTPRVNGGIGYNSKINGQGSQLAFRDAQRALQSRVQRTVRGTGQGGSHRAKGIEGLKEKDMVGMPWLLALALRSDGWYLRSDIIWHKPNAMPESVDDRVTKAHEYLFLLSKSERYYYDGEAIKEPATGNAHPRKAIAGWAKGPGSHDVVEHASRDRKFGVRQNPSFHAAISNEVLTSRNKRSVWTVPTEPFTEAHFATFPRKLIEPCILAGSRPGDIVFDPFMGAGTVASVATSLGRHWLGCEINPEYAAMIKPRAAQMGIRL